MAVVEVRADNVVRRVLLTANRWEVKDLQTSEAWQCCGSTIWLVVFCDRNGVVRSVNEQCRTCQSELILTDQGRPTTKWEDKSTSQVRKTYQ